MNIQWTSRRLLGLAVTAAAAAAAIGAGASAQASSDITAGNYHGPARPAPAAAAAHGANRGPASAGSSGSLRAPAAGAATHYYSLAASAFAPDGLHDTSEDYFNLWDPSTLSNTDTNRCFNAGLSLPAGAVLKSVTFYYTAGSTVMYVEINRQDLSAQTAINLADTDTATAASPTHTSTTLAIPAADATVQMKTYAYSAGVCPNGNTTFGGLTIAYTG